MQITRDNYEGYFIDYLDGKLSPGETNKLFEFLAENHDLAEELDGMKICVLKPVNERYLKKEELKKTFLSNSGIQNEFDYLCIANIEGDISLEEKKRLDVFIYENPSKKKQQLQYSKINLLPNDQIIFKNKLALKRNPIIKIKQSTYRNLMSIAAGFVLLLGIYSLFSLEKINNNQPLLTTLETESITSIKDDEASHIEENIVLPVNRDIQNEIQQLDRFEDKEQMPLVKDMEEEKRFIAFSFIEPKRLDEFSFPHPQIEPQILYFAKENEIILDEQFAEKTLINDPPKITSRTISAFELAQLGVQKLADFTGRPIELTAQKEQDGVIKSIHFESNLFAFSTSVGKKQ